MSRTRLAAFVLIGLGVLALILSGLAIANSRGGSSDVDPLAAKESRTAVPRGPATSTPTDSAAPSASASPAATSQAFAATPELPLAVAPNGTTIVIGSVGECGGRRGGPVSATRVSRDAGSSWTDGALPLARIDRLVATGQATSSSTQPFIAYGAAPSDCRLTVVGAEVGTATTALTWRATERTTNPLFRLAYVSGEIRTSAGSVTVPCEAKVIDVERASSGSERDAWVLCVDGSIAQSDDGGATWETRPSLKGAAALAVAPGGTAYVLQRSTSTSDCESGAAVVAWAGSTWEQRGCVALGSAAPPQGFEGSALGFGSDEAAVAVVDGRPSISTDAGRTWQPAEGL